MALVIGNGAYANSQLSKSTADAAAMGKALKDAGFSPVIVKTDLDYVGMSATFDEFVRQAAGMEFLKKISKIPRLIIGEMR